MIAYLESKTLGKPYVFGAAGPDEFDCSGLIVFGYAHWGVSIIHHAAEQARLGVAVARDAIQPGDLVFSNWDVANPRFGVTEAAHVGLAVAHDRIIVAPHTGEVVQIESITGEAYQHHLTGIRRYDMAPMTPAPKTVTVPIRKYGSPLTYDMTISGIAAHYGYGSNWQTIWNSQANAKLRSLRKSPERVQEGDLVVVTLKV
jgi:hypothetical protein